MSTATNTIAAEKSTVGLVGKFIADQSLEAGDRLPSIRELAAQFDVKAGAVRDALLEAQAKGIVSVLPRAGTFVAQATDELTSDSAHRSRLGTRLEQLLAGKQQFPVGQKSMNPGEKWPLASAISDNRRLFCSC